LKQAIIGEDFMVELCEQGAFLVNGRELIEDRPENQGRLEGLVPGGGTPESRRAEGARGTIAYGILKAHNGSGNDRELKLTYDAMASHDITFVNIVQTAKVSGLDEFPMPYVLTNCHNSLCAVGGTINEDDHRFGLSAARRYGGVYVPPHLAVIHTYVRENYAGCGKMILGSDSHTRYGSLGTMGVGEGGGELVKQLLRQSYDITYPKVIGVYLSGKPRNGTGPQDVALGIIGAVFKKGFAKNAVLEFIGEGIRGLPADYRAGIDVMTTETTCWSSIWETDDITREFLAAHLREGDYKKLSPGPLAYYDSLIRVDLSRIKPMIALPFHPSNVYEIDTLLANPMDILGQIEKDAGELIENSNIKLDLRGKVDAKKRIRADQGIVAGCAGGTFDNIAAAASILGTRGSGGGPGNEGFSLSVYPGSQPVFLELAEKGILGSLIAGGAIIRTAFCGPCFGAGDVPANMDLSVRHTTRNFPNREGSKPGNGQISSVCLMDARSIAATAGNGGYLASAEHLDWEEHPVPYHFNRAPYLSKVYDGTGKPEKNSPLVYGPNITDWPSMEALGENLLIKIVSFITDPVTTTDELIPSGETSSFRSNPLGLAEYTLSRKDPAYVGRAKEVMAAERLRLEGKDPSGALGELGGVLAALGRAGPGKNLGWKDLQLGSALYANKPGDGSAREQAASCQRVLGGSANFAHEYATKRYRSNLINWGLLPFIIEGEPPFKNGDYVFIPGAAEKIRRGAATLDAWVLGGGAVKAFTLGVPAFNPSEKEVVLAGSLINHNRLKLAGAS
jgi:aconitate hydratase